MSTWLVLAPERPDDSALINSAWIARQTVARAPHPPEVLIGVAAVRRAFEDLVGASPDLRGVAFFGHGIEDRLFDAERLLQADAPAVIDTDNVALLKGWWVHAFACLSGTRLADRAVVSGVEIYVGYQRPLDVGWAFPPPAEPEFLNLVTCVTFLLLAGERDARELRSAVSRAADDFFLALEATPGAEDFPGWMWLHKLAQDLVDHMVIVSR